MAASGRSPTDSSNGCLAAVRRGLLAGVAGLMLVGTPPAPTDARPIAEPAAAPAALAMVRVAATADFGTTLPGADARRLADWVVRVGDHQGRPFFLVDKAHATLYAFDRDARLQASTPVLLGAAPGDDSVPGIGTRPMAQILLAERTTPAGRFVAEAGRNLQGEDIVWVDHGAAISMHRVRTGNPRERRAQRLATPTIDDNRISYGCINVPVAFYDRHVQAVFADRRSAIVYVLPQTRPLEAQAGLMREPAPVLARASRPH
ncbi:hypothetical protein [uncultured Piscinibacter sp.]|uniref:hypothetical protein n=1 Tax=uncultured Piscinibacter sp. TaxID=1131835 RepID=UPI0026027D0F|nr:hypothetical protein [uncultured Piscinibacter sp.]